MTSFLLSLVSFVAFFINPVVSIGTTRYEIGDGDRMRDYQYVQTGCTGSGTNPSCAHKPSTSNKWIGTLPILGDLTGTGGTRPTTTGIKYAAGCYPNPFRRMGTGTGVTFFNTGTGTLKLLIYQNVRNPNAAGGGVGFVDSCGSGTGQSIIPSLCTASGCTQIFALSGTGGNLVGGLGIKPSSFGDKEFIKVGLNKNPTASFRGQVYFEVLGIGEKYQWPTP